MTILLFLVILSFLVIIHELGHFLTARKLGVRAEEFGIGFPPRIFGKRFGDTLYSINWIPFGGFVRLKGEEGENVEDEDSYIHKNIPERSLIVVAGVLVNFAFAVIILIAGFTIGMPSVIPEETPSHATVSDTAVHVVEIPEGTPASVAGLKVGDVIRAVNGEPVIRSKDLHRVTRASLNKEIVLEVKRDGELRDIPVTVATIDGQPRIGALLTETGLLSYPLWQAVIRGTAQAFDFSWQILVSFGSLLRDLVVTQSISPDIAGPVGIAVLTGQVAGLGFPYLLQFIAVLSLSLAIINILPIPALDGGRFFFLIIERIRGKAVSAKVEGVIHGIGFYVLLLFLVVISVRDFSRFGISGAITSFFQRIF